MNMSCVHPMVCGDSQVSTNTVSSGRVQLTAVCTNPSVCLSVLAYAAGLCFARHLRRGMSQLHAQEKAIYM